MLNIAVDGYSSTGKGVVCTKLAKELGIIHFDTGAIYRVIGLYVRDNGINPRDEKAVTEALPNIKVDVKHNEGNQITILNGEDVSTKIRENEISDVCSITSPYPACRDFVLNIQRDIASKYDIVMEGRDITSHVLPNADFKFFLDASIDVRTERRYKELVEKGEKVTFDKVLCISGETLSVGAPYVADATVVATVLKNGKSKKIDVIRYKAKKNEKKKIGHRQDYTKVQIEKIEG